MPMGRLLVSFRNVLPVCGYATGASGGRWPWTEAAKTTCPDKCLLLGGRRPVKGVARPRVAGLTE